MKQRSIEMKGSDGRMYQSDLFKNKKHIVHIVTKSTSSHLHQAVKRMIRLVDDFSDKGYAFYVICDMNQTRFLDFVNNLKNMPLWLLDKDFRFTKDYISVTHDLPKTCCDHDLTLIVDENGTLLQRIVYRQCSPHVEKYLKDR